MQKELVCCDAIELCGFDELGHELREIKFKDVTLGDKENPVTQSLSLRLCERVSLENINCF